MRAISRGVAGAVLWLGAAVATPGAAEGLGDYAQFLDGVRQEALGRGVSAHTVDAALEGLAPLPRVIALDQRQPEFSMTYAKYMRGALSRQRIERGRRRYAEHRRLIDEVARRYNVPARYIVALWGMETGFGAFTGGFPVVASLATLAYDGRRSRFFRGELMNALTILDAEQIPPAALKGSWAGAMGQCQFMPSSFLKYAQDYDGDGRRDIWHDQGDVFASIANYLATVGWDAKQGWGYAVTLPARFDRKLATLEVAKTPKEWRALGLRGAGGKALPQGGAALSLVVADQGKGPAFLVTENFRTILHWNRSTLFALAAGHLADSIVKP